MNCLAIENILDLYAERLLTSSRHGQVDRHVKRCPRCQESLAQVRLPGLPAAKAPAGFKARLKRSLSAEPPAPGLSAALLSPGPRLGAWGRDSVPVLAAAALAFCLSLLLRAGIPTVPSPRSAPPVPALRSLP